MNMQEEGYRYVMRPSGSVDGVEFRWVWAGFIEPTDTDCTDLTDEEFSQVARRKA